MQVIIKNSSEQPFYVKFENEPDLNIDKNHAYPLKLTDGSQLNVVGDHIETKAIKRPI